MRAARVRVTRFLAAALGVAMLAGCVSPPPPSGGGSSGPATRSGPVIAPSGPATVALLVPLSGANADAAQLGAALENAARMALAELGGSRIDLRVYDTAGDAGTAAAVTSQALAEGAGIILGPLFSANTSAAGAIAARADVPVISFSTDSSVAGNGVFVSGYTPEAEAARVIGFARARGIGTFGIVYPQTAYGQAALSAARIAAGPGTIVAEQSYPRSFEGIQAGTDQFAALYNSTRPEGILMPESGQGLRTLGSFLDYHGISAPRVQYLGLGTWNSRDTLREPALRGGWFPSPDPDRVEDFARRYRAAHGSTPPVLASLAYDAVLVASQLLEEAGRAGSDSPFSEEALTRGRGFRGAFGPMRFTRDGIAVRSMAIIEVGDSDFRVIDPAPATIGAGS